MKAAIPCHHKHVSKIRGMSDTHSDFVHESCDVHVNLAEQPHVHGPCAWPLVHGHTSGYLYTATCTGTPVFKLLLQYSPVMVLPV
jgi:hypothetical protein